MGTVGHLAEEIERGLLRVHPGLRKTVTRKLAATVAAVLQAQTANTAAWAAVLPIETERDDMRLQWIARLLANPLLDGVRVMEPFARQRLNEAAANGQTVVLSMDQTDLGDRFAILMVSLRVVGERALPLAWAVESGAAVLLAADRFYPSASLFAWLQAHGWGYRLRLKGNHALDIGCADVTGTGDFAGGSHNASHAERACSNPGSRPIWACCTRQGIPSRGSSPWTVFRALRRCAITGCAGASSRCSRTSRAAASVWKTPNCAAPNGSPGWS